MSANQLRVDRVIAAAPTAAFSYNFDTLALERFAKICVDLIVRARSLATKVYGNRVLVCGLLEAAVPQGADKSLRARIRVLGRERAAQQVHTT